MKRRELRSLLIILITVVLLQSCKLQRIDPPCPIIDSLSPSAGKFDDIISIKGKNFLTGSSGFYRVNIGDTTIPVFDIPDVNTIRFKVPKGKSGLVTVVLNGLYSCNATSKKFTYYYTATMVSKLIDGLNSPAGLDLDYADNVVVADRLANRIKIIKPSGNPSQIGELIKTYGVDTGNCTTNVIFNGENAYFGSPSDVKVDLNNNIWVAEYGWSVIRRIKPDGSLVFYAGTCHTVGYGGIPGPLSNVVVLNNPMNIAIDGNDFYFTDRLGIIKIDAFNYVTLLTPISMPSNIIYRGIEVSRSRTGSGPIFITDEAGKTIKSIDEGGSQSNVDFSPNLLLNPVALAIDSKGNIFVADKDRHQIFVIYTNGVLQTLAGTAVAGYQENVPGAMAKFNEPAGIALNEKRGVLYVSDSKNKAVRTIRIE